MASRYWMVSLPVQSSASSLWSRLQESISKQAFDTPLYRFSIPELRVGTLDSLLALSDDLLKSNAFVEGVSHKIRRQVEDLERASGVYGGGLTVNGVPVDSYLTRFVWDEAKFPVMSPLREIVDSIHVQVAKIEDDMKVRSAEYNNVRSQLNAINRKQTGSLAIRDLSNLVKPEDIITSEHLVTLMAVVPKYSQKDWLSCYETLTTYVVFSSWMHFCAIRVFAESILRYGLPPSFLAAILAPPVKSEKKVRRILDKFCGDSNSAYWKSEDDVGIPGLVGEAEAYPYVSFTINIF